MAAVKCLRSKQVIRQAGTRRVDTKISFWLTAFFMITLLMVKLVPDLWYSTQGRGEVSVQSLRDCALRD